MTEPAVTPPTARVALISEDSFYGKRRTAELLLEDSEYFQRMLERLGPCPQFVADFVQKCRLCDGDQCVTLLVRIYPIYCQAEVNPLFLCRAFGSLLVELLQRSMSTESLFNLLVFLWKSLSNKLPLSLLNPPDLAEGLLRLTVENVDSLEIQLSCLQILEYLFEFSESPIAFLTTPFLSLFYEIFSSSFFVVPLRLRLFRLMEINLDRKVPLFEKYLIDSGIVNSLFFLLESMSSSIHHYMPSIRFIKFTLVFLYSFDQIRRYIDSDVLCMHSLLLSFANGLSKGSPHTYLSLVVTPHPVHKQSIIR